MAVTGTLTVRDLCTRALRKANITEIGGNPSSEDMSQAVAELELMLKGWQAKGYFVWTTASGSLTLTTDASYTLDPVRPLRMISARLRRSGIDTPMERLTRDGYDSLPVKTSTGLPTTFYYDRQREAARLYVWPVLASADGETVEYTYEREIEDIGGEGDTLDLPAEWWEAAEYNLAVRLLETIFGQAPQAMLMRAEMLIDEVMAFDRDDSVFFAGPYAV